MLTCTTASFRRKDAKIKLFKTLTSNTYNREKKLHKNRDRFLCIFFLMKQMGFFLKMDSLYM